MKVFFLLFNIEEAICSQNAAFKLSFSSKWLCKRSNYLNCPPLIIPKLQNGNFSINFFMTEVPIIKKPVHWFAQNWFLYDKYLRHEKANTCFLSESTIKTRYHIAVLIFFVDKFKITARYLCSHA